MRAQKIRSRGRDESEEDNLQVRPPFVRQPTGFDLAAFQTLVGAEAITRLRREATRLHLAFHGGDASTTVWHINSSGVGGGVADILNSLVSFSVQLGVPTKWLVIGGDERFFQITKTFHNALQGDASAEITAEMVAHYLRVTAASAHRFEELITRESLRPPDVIVFHDPQPAGLIPLWRARFPHAVFVWQGHIQFDVQALAATHPGGTVWRLLTTYVNQCDAAIFHLREQVPRGVLIPVRCFLPSIDPMGYLNRPLTTPAGSRFVDSTLRKYQMDAVVDRSIPLVVQVARFDAWKDPLGVVEAYRQASERLSNNGGSPHLLLAGPLAPDDPEAFAVLARLGETVNGDGRVHIVPLRPDGTRVSPDQARSLNGLGVEVRDLGPGDLVDLEINAFQTRADVIVAKSLREGFGLSVAGAGYHGKPRIVSHVGGLHAQVTDDRGRAHACLVGGTPDFNRAASIHMTRDWLVDLLSNPRRRVELGAAAKRHVVRAFLPHRHLQDYLTLFRDIRSQNPPSSEP